MSATTRLERVQSFIAQASRLTDPTTPLGQRALSVLPNATGLTEQGVRHALTTCLERELAAAEFAAWCASVPVAETAHVSLAANVFTAPLRAIALGLGVAKSVCVRPSRREPVFTELLAAASPGTFEIVAELQPHSGDHVFAYGSDRTLAEFEAALPAGVVFHGHGFGMGVAVVDEDTLARPSDLAQRLALDTVAFDQRGCLSPRLVLVDCEVGRAREFARDLAKELLALDAAVPRGRLLEDEQADIVRYRATMSYLAEVFGSEEGMVVLDTEVRGLPIPPTGRNLLVVNSRAPADFLAPIASAIAALGLGVSETLEALVRQRLPGARVSAIGHMQRPPLDGPVDRRTRPRVL